jgi:hypothetical protein
MSFLQLYSFLSLMLMFVTAAYVVLVERELQRRIILVLLYITVAAPGGADYRMLYAAIALLILIIIKSRRRYDFLVTTLLALALIPKREILLPFYEGGDHPGAINGASVTIIISPLLLICSYVLLMRDGWQLRIPGWGWQRLRGLLNSRHLPYMKAG